MLYPAPPLKLFNFFKGPLDVWQKQSQRWAIYKDERAQAEAARLQAEAEERARIMALWDDAEYIASMLPDYLKRAGLYNKLSKFDRQAQRTFDYYELPYIVDYLVAEDGSEMRFRIGTGRNLEPDLPEGVAPADFDARIEKRLTFNYGMPARVEADNAELWIVFQVQGVSSLPKLVTYTSMIKAMPKSAPALAYPIGPIEDGSYSYGDLEEQVVVGVFGSKGFGKSNLLHNMVCTFINRNSPRDLRLFLTDLKEGLDFFEYNAIPFLGGDVEHKIKVDPEGPPEKLMLGREVITEAKDTLEMLKYVDLERKRRGELMQGKAKKISAWNAKYPKKALSFWVVIIDELATLMESEYAKSAKPILAELVRKGRAVGVFIVLSTQVMEKHVIIRQIAGNIDARFVAKQGDGSASGQALGDGTYDAAHLPAHIKGRMIYKWMSKVVVQTPYIPEMIIRQHIKAAMRGEITSTRQTEENELAQRLFTYALDKLYGHCKEADLYAHFKHQNIRMAQIRNILKGWEVQRNEEGVFEPEIEIDGFHYYLSPSRRVRQAGTQPRQLVKVAKFEEEYPEQWERYVKNNGQRTTDNTEFVPTALSTQAKREEEKAKDLVLEAA